MVISEADNLVQAQDNVYSYLSKLDLPDCFYRHDIGNRALRDQMYEESPGWGFFVLDLFIGVKDKGCTGIIIVV